jgi:hypothetical protein
MATGSSGLAARLKAGVSPALETYVWSRVVIWGAAALSAAWFETHRHVAYGTSLWVRWDSGWYLSIARHGYASDPTNAPAFFPLYPGLIRILGEALGGRYALAGLLISLVSCAIAFELLWRLARSRLGAEGASRAVLYLAIFPTALFLQAVYTESLYLMLVLAAFTFAERGRWPLAAISCGLALLTRSSGVAVLAGLAVLAWPDRRRLAWLAVVPAMFAAFPILLQLQVHHPFSFLSASAEWDRHFSPAGPFGGVWDAFARLGDHPEGATVHHALAVNIEDLLFLALFLALLPLVWRRFGAVYGVFATVSLLLPLSTPVRDYPLLSLPRFGLVVFPFFLALATLGKSPRAHGAIVAVSALLLGVAVVQWVTFQWVS